MAEAQFVSDPLVIRWQSKLLKKSKSTARVYGEFLFTYWSKALKPRGLTLSGWLEELQRESEAKDNTVRTRWGTDLEEFVTTYVSESTKKGYAFKSRRLFVTALRNFLGFHLGQRGYEPYKFDLETSEEAVARKKEREDTKPISVEEFKRLVLSVKNNSVRDKAILLTLANGLGPGEWLQFSQEWHKYAQQIREKKVPIIVSVVRPKTHEAYRVWFWEDAVEYMHMLLENREREVEHILTEKDPLFVSYQSKKAVGNVAVPITQHRLQEMIRDLADYTGLDPRVPGKIIYRIRPAEIGRDFFRTLCENAGVPESISEYLLGHKVDPLDYNKFHRTDEGKARIEEELQKVRPLLNVISGTGKPTVNPDLPYLDKLKSTAEEHGLTPEELVASLIPFAKRLPVFGEIKKKLWKEGKGAESSTGEMIVPSEEILKTMTKDQLRPAVISWAKARTDPNEIVQRLTGNRTPKKLVQKLVKTDELQHYMDNGWFFRSVVNTEYVLVEREESTQPPNESATEQDSRQAGSQQQ